ncbi:MAG: DUF1016 N-terminal domain-containing protein, partial [Flavobacteriales bacterium]
MKYFDHLINTIESVHGQLQASATKAVNQALIIRNWLIGYYIVEFEQNGEDRARYGKALLKSIAEGLQSIKGLDERSLRRFRQFYLTYPQLASTIRGLLTPVSEENTIRGSATPILVDLPNRESLPVYTDSENLVPGDKIISNLSYTHI